MQIVLDNLTLLTRDHLNTENKRNHVMISQYKSQTYVK